MQFRCLGIADEGTGGEKDLDIEADFESFSTVCEFIYILYKDKLLV